MQSVFYVEQAQEPHSPEANLAGAVVVNLRRAIRGSKSGYRMQVASGEFYSKYVKTEVKNKMM